SQADSSMRFKAEFDYERYVAAQLSKPFSFGFLLEYAEEIVGFLFIYIYDETPPPHISELELLENPFVPRRVGAVLWMYVQESHRKPSTITLLTEAAIAKAEELKVTDIDLLVSIDQTGIHALLERFGFTKAAIQYTKHYDINETNLPDLRPSYQNAGATISNPGGIPLKDPQTQALVRNAQGEGVYLYPLTNESGEWLKSSRGMPIYPIPVRDPQSQKWVFDESGELVVCPVAYDEQGKIQELDGIPQFRLPTYDYVEGKLMLKQDDRGNYLFSN
ncbi:MAG: GNAT family N-acetyltransferase, partial [Microcystaceae cyanobacterium]